MKTPIACMYVCTVCTCTRVCILSYALRYTIGSDDILPGVQSVVHPRRPCVDDRVNINMRIESFIEMRSEQERNLTHLEDNA